MELIKKQFPEDYDGLKSIEPLVESYLDFESVKNLGIQINQNDVSFYEYQVFSHVNKVRASWSRT